MPRYDDDDDDWEDDDEEEETGLEVRTDFFPLAWILFFCTPRIEIDGKVHTKPWGTHFFRLKPGKYKVTVYFPYMFSSRCGENSLRVRVRQGETTRVAYYMPPWMFLAGSIREVD